MDKRCTFVNSPAEQGRGKGAERHAVEQRAERGEKDGIEPRAAGGGAQPEQEQAREDDQREEHVEPRPREPAAAPSGRLQRVEHQSERVAQHERECREHGLLRHRGRHPKSLAQKPSPRWGVSA